MLTNWSLWVERHLGSDLSNRGSTDELVPKVIAGLSPDGAIRLVWAFGGGERALVAARINGNQSWIGARSVAGIAELGLCRLWELSDGRPAHELAAVVCQRSISAIASGGVSLQDRAIANRILRMLGVVAKPRTRIRVLHEQYELFSDAWDHLC